MTNKLLWNSSKSMEDYLEWIIKKALWKLYKL